MSKLVVWYPNAGPQRVTGEFLGAIRHEGACTPVIDTGSCVLFVDPRCVIFAEGSPNILYTPRDYIDVLASVFVEWLRDNPTWPPRPSSLLKEGWKPR